MARTTAVCTCRVCGKEFEKDMYGSNRRDADRKAEWAAEYFDLCEVCYKEEQERKAKEALEKMKEDQKKLGFADLEGAEWQIEKAVKIRQHIIEGTDWKWCNKGKITELNPENSIRDALSTITAILYIKSERNAAKWVAMGEEHISIASLERKFREVIPNYQFEDGELIVTQKAKPQAEPKQEPKIEELPFTLEAEDAIDVTCTIIIKSDKIAVKTSGYSKTITDLMHAEKYSWDRANYYWSRSALEEEKEDMVCEIGAKLNAKHITCTYPNKTIADKAISGDYKAENKRWIYAKTNGGVRTGYLMIEFEDNEEIRKAVSTLKGAKYSYYEWTVNAKNWREIRDFAKIYNFNLTQGTEEELKKAEATSALGTATVKKMEQQGKSLEDILNSSRDVLEDLKDD